MSTLVSPISRVGKRSLAFIDQLGSLTMFALRTMCALRSGLPPRRTLLPILNDVGVASLPTVLVTGTFIGMVLAVQTHTQFKMLHMESRIGAVITMTLVSELGPVLAATMLAGRVGSAMAAELGTMRVTEQIHAITALGSEPVRYLALPRFLACLFLIPLLTAFADLIGMVSGWLFSSVILGVNSFQYWDYARDFVTAWDVLAGLFKSLFFGAAIALIACHEGFHCGAGAEGVGQAATRSFVLSFVVILGSDFLLTVLLNSAYYAIWSTPVSL